MYVRFVVDPFVPHGINKVIRRVIRDLRVIFKDITYSVETDESFNAFVKSESVPVSKIFQRKLPMMCRGIVVYILNVNLTWNKNDVYGISSPNKCIVGLKDITKNGYHVWAAKIWEIILHEVGHSLGLIRRHRARSSVSHLGTMHCINDCVMSEETFDLVWSRKALMRFNRGTPYCDDCLKYLLAKDV